MCHGTAATFSTSACGDIGLHVAREGGFNADPFVDVEDREDFGNEIAEGIRRGEKFQRTGDSVEYSELSDRKITPGMSDEEREAILRAKGSFIAAEYTGQADESLKRNESDLSSKKNSTVRSALQRIYAELGLDRKVTNADLDVSVAISKGPAYESRSRRSASNEEIVKILSVADRAVQSAVATEIHANRYFSDRNTRAFVNLIGAYADGEDIVPVQFGLKQDRYGHNTLYILVSDQKI